MKKIIVFASGGGSNFEALAEACKSGYIDGKIILLVAGKAGIGAIEKAQKFDIPVFVDSPSPQPSPARGEGEREYSALPQGARVKELDCYADKKQSARNDGSQFSPFCKGSAAEGGRDLIKILQNLKPDLICLAGYLKRIPQEILDICPVMNIHPALLPNFGGKGMYGHHVHEAVIKSGAKESGATVHFVNKNYDEGQIIKQVEVPVLPNDTPQSLSDRILKEEHKLYPLCVKFFCEGKL
jgi:formyltetrahydrofolate-dependent phosphoribosylglycinamide formyltransferase